jgi:hypothetical protein
VERLEAEIAAGGAVILEKTEAHHAPDPVALPDGDELLDRRLRRAIELARGNLLKVMR